MTDLYQSDFDDYKQKVESFLLSQNYGAGIKFLEEYSELYPEEKSFYAYSGLFSLLQGEEEDAQSAWMAPCLEFQDDDDLTDWMNAVSGILRKEADRRISEEDFQTAWLIYQHSREIVPQDIHTALQLLRLAAELNLSPIEELENFLAIDREEILPDMEDIDLLLSVMEIYLKITNISIQVLDFIDFCEPALYSDIPAAIYMLMRSAIDYASRSAWLDPSIRLAELALRLDPQNFEALGHLSGFYDGARMYDESIRTASICLNSAVTLPQKIHAHSLLMRGVMGKGGAWSEATAIFEQGQTHFKELLSTPELELNQLTNSWICNAIFLHPYIIDSPVSTRELQNKVSQICHSVTQFCAGDSVTRYSEFHTSKLSRSSWPLKRRLKIGYLCHCFRSHSVGWLARWLIKHHDRDQFEVYGYFVAHRTGSDDLLQSWYENQFEHVRKFGVNSQEIADMIHQDDLDILIDLDSITIDISYDVMAMKPAPIQATWLGMDASGLPSIDYFIADHHVLPEMADEYYQEKIIRLPGPYLAVDGFEVDVPNLTRNDLSIPEDAVIFLSCQSGLKRNIETVRCQLQIISAVPNSYFLIKGPADQTSVAAFFQTIATEEGLDLNRLRFLPNTASEAIHRANLKIADVVLDTYPYNGATTTMETLWMEVPIVTRVGEQFAARNSYTMMINAGITEGIAWSAAEYIEWGIKLGTDAKLRQEVSWKLRESKKTSPLWDGKKFARHMEEAYESMYKHSIDHNQDDEKQDPSISSVAVSDTKIIIDGVFFQLYKTGIARLWKSLLEVWSKEEFRNNLLVLDREGTCPRIPGINYRSVQALNYQDIDSDRLLLQAICEEEHADIFISTYYTTPIDTPSVLMGYDMIPEVFNWDLRHPMWISKKTAIDHASSYITISENTARDLEKFYPQVTGAPITPALCGVAPYFYPANSLELMTFRERFNLRKPYFLLIGPSMGYKNAELFLNGLIQLVSRQGFDVVCTGGSAPTFSAEARSLVPDVMFHALSLNDDQLRAAYSGAIALVYPSKYEGFGLPIVEAMKCNCPVITCANASLPEVGGDAVLYVGDNDADGMTNALLKVQRSNVRTELIRLGSEQANKFTWQNMGDTIKKCLSNQVKTLREVDNTKIRKILILIDWKKDEDVILESILKFLQIAQSLENLESYEFVVDIGEISVEDADTFFSSGMMYFLMENEAPELAELKITFLSPQEVDNSIAAIISLMTYKMNEWI